MVKYFNNEKEASHYRYRLLFDIVINASRICALGNIASIVPHRVLRSTYITEMMMKTIVTLVILAFWTCYFMYDMADKDKSCVNVTSSMYCPKDLMVAQGEVNYYHTIAISSLAFCFMITLHLVFSILNHQELSMLMIMTTSILIALFAFSHWGVENFMFHCLGFLIGVYGANLSIFIHLLYIYWQTKRLRKTTSASTVEAEDGGDGISETIELRNNQPGYFYDINTRTHILNFDIN